MSERPSDGDARRAARLRRRARRRRLRRLGQACYVLAVVLLAIATYGLFTMDDDGGDGDAAGDRRRDQARGVATASSLLPAWATSTSVSLPPGFLGTDIDATAAEVPRGNSPPVVRAPSVFEVADEGLTLVEHVSVEDREATSEGGDIGVLVYAEHGRIEFGSTAGVELYTPNGSPWIPIIGTIDAINTTLASIQYDPGPAGPHTLQVVVSDFGHDGRYRTLIDVHTVALRLV